MSASQVLEDVLIHPHRHSEPEREFTLEVALYQLRRPLTTDEAASVLGVSKPTVLSWVKAGLLPAVGKAGRGVSFLIQRRSLPPSEF
jgi:excisionase family DNA binding protein